MLEEAENQQFKASCASAFFSTPFSPPTKTQHSRLHNGDSKWLIYLLMLILVVCLVEYYDSRVTMPGPKVCMATHGT